MNCVHCGKERPYSWVGGQHCQAPIRKPKPINWPYPPTGRIPTDWEGVRDYAYMGTDTDTEEDNSHDEH